jgi:hypothetical protein
MSHFPLLVVLLLALSFILPMIFRLFSGGPRDKARVVVEYAQRKGYALVNPSLAQALDSSRLEMLRNPALRNSIKASSDIADIEELDNGTGDWLAFTFDLGSKQVTVFNLSVTPRQINASGGSILYKVAKIRASGLPRFSLGRNSAINTVENVVGQIVGAPKATIHVDARQYPEFSAHFWIRGSDPGAVTAFLSSSKIRFLESAKLQGTLATNANYLVYFEDGVLLSEKDFDSFIAKVETLATDIF